MSPSTKWQLCPHKVSVTIPSLRMRVLLLLALLAFQLRSYGAADTPDTTDPCVALNTSCEECISGAEDTDCYMCAGACLRLDFSGLTSGSCPLEELKLGQCTLSALALIVVISGGALLLLLAGCVLMGLALYCYCKFCRKCRGAPKPRGNDRVDTEMRDMKERNSQRRAERTARNDETRRKYGLVDEEDTSRYQRF